MSFMHFLSGFLHGQQNNTQPKGQPTAVHKVLNQATGSISNDVNSVTRAANQTAPPIINPAHIISILRNRQGAAPPTHFTGGPSSSKPSVDPLVWSSPIPNPNSNKVPFIYHGGVPLSSFNKTPLNQNNYSLDPTAYNVIPYPVNDTMASLPPQSPLPRL